MKVKELIVQLLNECMEDEVIIRTVDKDRANVDGIEALVGSEYNGYVSLSIDVRLIRE